MTVSPSHSCVGIVGKFLAHQYTRLKSVYFTKQECDCSFSNNILFIFSFSSSSFFLCAISLQNMVLHDFLFFVYVIKLCIFNIPPPIPVLLTIYTISLAYSLLFLSLLTSLCHVSSPSPLSSLGVLEISAIPFSTYKLMCSLFLNSISTGQSNPYLRLLFSMKSYSSPSMHIQRPFVFNALSDLLPGNQLLRAFFFHHQQHIFLQQIPTATCSQ